MRAPDSIIGNSEALATALDHLSRLAPVNRPVIVVGERGTGKELAAERLHFLSTRWEAPFIKVNCAAMAEALLESELFGHEAGAFTGATAMHRGRFERADGGTLFLDELGTTSARLQEKLLRLVEYGEFERLGGQRTLRVDVRVVAATHADLPAMAAAGEFRHDLLDRLAFDIVYLPPLRERREDIAGLAEHFAIQMSAELGWPLFPGFTEAALAQLEAHSWPGNVRELKNAVERSVYRWGDSGAAVATVALDPFADARPRETTAAVPLLTEAPADAEAAAGEVPLRERVDAFEHRLLAEALASHGHHQKRTAEALGLSYDQLRGLLRRHGLRSRRPRRDTAGHN
ncbi:phage shock protein operon transcriptional activator [Pseudohaliea rubra]|uniref:Psp operon transcriptional activator n=1 Tax=Pseudohaliea rubra DSM 19751 TaxID=1265313 RepID=A0A095VN34_9GAMM|nr:phage shock protein operon transcriptional activator [Pseudohaliea rubra]KGE02887.1 Psp operon transcriptional activator [Pseudohaliea rubra DSM 19751]